MFPMCDTASMPVAASSLKDAATDSSAVGSALAQRWPAARQSSSIRRRWAFTAIFGNGVW